MVRFCTNNKARYDGSAPPSASVLHVWRYDTSSWHHPVWRTNTEARPWQPGRSRVHACTHTEAVDRCTKSYPVATLGLACASVSVCVCVLVLVTDWLTVACWERDQRRRITDNIRLGDDKSALWGCSLCMCDDRSSLRGVPLARQWILAAVRITSREKAVVRTDLARWVHASTHTHTHTEYTHTRARARRTSTKHTLTHTRVRTVYTHTHTHTRAYSIHAHTRTHTHTR